MNIKELRTKEGLSQSALAKKLGVATSAIGHMENGRMKVSAKIAAKAKEVYGVVLDTEAKAEKAAKATVKKTKAVTQKAETAVKRLRRLLKNPLSRRKPLRSTSRSSRLLADRSLLKKSLRNYPRIQQMFTSALMRIGCIG